MHLQVKPYHSNSFPPGGILIKGSELQHWLQQLQYLQVDLSRVPVYAVPGATANSLWGCFVPLADGQWKQEHLNACEPCQLLFDKLYIPQYANIYPMISAAEAAKMFPSAMHLLHPEFGLLVLDTPVQWGELLLLPEPLLYNITRPADTVFIPSKIQRVEVQSLPPEALLKDMEEKTFPKKESFDDKPLNLAEKMKMHLLRALFKPAPGGIEVPGGPGGEGKEQTGLMKALDKLLGKMMPGLDKWASNKIQDLEALEKRNQSEMEKLLDMLRKDRQKR
ncbi:hypothetical protein [Ferruginibacter sp.]